MKRNIPICLFMEVLKLFIHEGFKKNHASDSCLKKLRFYVHILETVCGLKIKKKKSELNSFKTLFLILLGIYISCCIFSMLNQG